MTYETEVQSTRARDRIAVPPQMADLPVDERGFRVPWFVAVVNDKPDHRIANPERIPPALAKGLCWICGKKLRSVRAFVIGPMCSINRITTEPPSHLECARYSVQVCPFLTQPKMTRRRTVGDGMEQTVAPEGMLDHNPGVNLIWVTRKYRLNMIGDGTLIFDLGSPSKVEWWREGQLANREHCLIAIAPGLSRLSSLAEQEGPEAVADLGARLSRAMRLLPTH